MNKKLVFAVTLALTCAFAAVSCWGCSSGADSGKAADSQSAEHPTITMQSPFRDTSSFLDVLEEKYPEINVEIVPYSGKNYTAFVKDEFASGDMPDIYCATYYTPNLTDLSDKLIDLSSYDFTDNYADARLADVTDSTGAVYLLPTYYNCIGITYNKTLLEKHGWTLPTSMEELRDLAAKAKEAGVNLCLDEVQLPGYGFQYLCNILSAGYLNTPGGREWQTSFLEGKTNLSDSPEMMQAMQTLQEWRDLGMFNADASATSDNDTRLQMAKGNTLFLLGSTNTFTDDETTDEFGIMPYLSEDGTSNAYILQVSRYLGLNKKLQEPGNEQKLQDALHVMEVLSTVEGMQALNSHFADTSLLPLKDYKVKSDGLYADIEDELNAGASAPFIYSGWDNMITTVGESMISFIRGTASLDDVVKTFDDKQSLLWDKSSITYTTPSEKIDTDHCAKLIGISFAKAANADIALISKNKWYRLDDTGDLNLDGVSGALFPLPVSDEEITSILPTGWRGNIQTVTLSGARVKELAEAGYDRDGTGEHPFPYELVTREGFTIDDDATYTVAIAGVSKDVAAEGNLTDTGILGLDAARSYLSSFDALSEDDIVWN